tara:strand:- start:859 stop:2493 length:1635 start_codon:yes stop_codon:yes gene_type:complete
MFKIKKNKKGAVVWIVMGVILLSLSVGVLSGGLRNVAFAADEKIQVDFCRGTNEVRVFVEDKTKIISPSEICNTIDKREKKFQVPTKRYKRIYNGAEAEMRDMIKSCWYMWLDGQEQNTFRNYPFTTACQVCYAFKIDDKIEDVTFEALETSLLDPLFAEDKSDQCVPQGGFMIPSAKSCEESFDDWRKDREWKEVPSKKAFAKGERCCISKDPQNECENKGGKCSTTIPGKNMVAYSKWTCPKKENCYVEEDDKYSYIRYIREGGSLEGDVVFMRSERQEAEGVSYIRGEEYAISFVSPSEQFCATEEGDVGCYATIGGIAIGLSGSGLAAYKITKATKAATAATKAAVAAAEANAATAVAQAATKATAVTQAETALAKATEKATKAAEKASTIKASTKATQAEIAAATKASDRAATKATQAATRLTTATQASQAAQKNVVITQAAVKHAGKSVGRFGGLLRKVIKVNKFILPKAGKLVGRTIVPVSFGMTFLEMAGLDPIDMVLKTTTSFLASPITEEIPNMIVVSTLERAREMECTEKYGV